MNVIKTLFAIFALSIFAVLASAHEVRPAYLEITQDSTANYRIVWKQPASGDQAIHLVPHLSSTWLEKSPDDQFATAGFLIRTWHVDRNDKANLSENNLLGNTITIEGLEYTMLDVLVRIHFANGRDIETIIRPGNPQFTLPSDSHAYFTVPAYLGLGIEHIFTGPDHLLFVFGLLLIVRNWLILLKTVSAFTLAHSMTLAAVVLGKLSVPPAFVEVMIALSILFLAPEILRVRSGLDSVTIRNPWAVAFVFGLFHGMGFASALTSLGFERENLVSALLFFNFGVEIGQLSFIALVLMLGRALRAIPLCRHPVIAQIPVYVVGIGGAFWTIQNSAIWLGGQ
jgi:hypothetical protein